MAQSRLQASLRAFRHRDYRLFFAGQLISLVGTWMQTVAQAWFVYRLTGSETLLGVVGFASQFPIFPEILPVRMTLSSGPRRTAVKRNSDYEWLTVFAIRPLLHCRFVNASSIRESCDMYLLTIPFPRTQATPTFRPSHRQN